jgi:hypothetical protein
MTSSTASQPCFCRHSVGIPDPEVPPYALLSTPVYSLVSEGSSGRQTMNMITYASPIALRPQRKYALGLYVQSLTYQNIKETGRAVLQVCCVEVRAVGSRCT